jgi:hypothetical protein
MTLAIEVTSYGIQVRVLNWRSLGRDPCWPLEPKVKVPRSDEPSTPPAQGNLVLLHDTF